MILFRGKFIFAVSLIQFLLGIVQNKNDFPHFKLMHKDKFNSVIKMVVCED